MHSPAVSVVPSQAETVQNPVDIVWVQVDVVVRGSGQSPAPSALVTNVFASVHCADEYPASAASIRVARTPENTIEEEFGGGGEGLRRAF